MGCCFHKDESPTQTVYFGREQNPQSITNQIQTTQYSILTFLPKALFFQFLRPANYVYLITAIAQAIPQISSLSPFTAIAPLIFVLGIALVKEAIQDYKRYSKDKEINNQFSEILINRQFVSCKWMDIHVGDIIRIKDDEMVPADIILLHSTEQNSICYVQTSNLDGQSNLKTKNAFVQGTRIYPNQFQILKGQMIVERPNSNLHEFNGNIHIANHEMKPISMDNLLVRGSVVKNTEHVVGVVVYAGHNTKIMKNTGDTPHKVSGVQSTVNRIQLFLLFVLLILSLGCSIGYYRYHTAYSQGNRKDFFYLSRGGTSQNMLYESFLIFFTSFLLLSFLIPISMNVALEGIKIFAGYFLGWDQKMYYKPLDKYCSALNLSIIQQLGLVDYVLTDKTGTLTANQMKFRYVFINDTKYDDNYLRKCFQENNKSLGKQFHKFWLGVIICHDVVYDIKKSQYQGSSPDQVCFVEYADTIGYKFVKRTRNYIELNILGQKIVYQFLNMIPFSPRKRMSVIVRDLTTNVIYLYTKGADTAIISKSKHLLNQQKIQENLTSFSMQGLRTLVFSQRQISQKQYLAYTQQLLQIKNTKLLGKQQKPQRLQQQMQKLTESIQSDLQIIGISAIEDRLQDRVPQTISRLQQAGIIVMMITGDKLETAENIGYLSNFIRRNATVYRIRTGTKDVLQQINHILSNIKQGSNQQFSVMIEADCIAKFIQIQQQQPVLLLKKCQSVIFCRSTPKEKGSIVKFVKERMKGIVLAIGDGGNDVGMIQQANIGIGLMGKQGNQAAASSDFCFAQFRFLDRLLLHHGRWAYYRMAYFFVYYGWKNLVMTMILLLFMIYSVFSGFPGFSQPFITVYNSVIALILVVYYSILEQDINSDNYPDAYAHLPLFYKQYKQLKLFSYTRYIIWTILALLLSVVLHYVFVFVLGSNIVIDSDGHPGDFNTYSSGMALSLSIIVISIIVVDMNNFTWLSFGIAFLLLTVLPAVLFFIIENFVVLGNINIAYALTDNKNFRFFAVLFLVSTTSLLVKIGWNNFLFEFQPTYLDQQLQVRERKKNYQSVKPFSMTQIHLK